MGSLIKRPLNHCIGFYEEYKEDKRLTNVLEERDRINSQFKRRNSYQIKSFLNDNSYMEKQKWIQEQMGKEILFHPEKIISAYPDYQFDQEAMEKRWDKVVIHQNNISFERDLNKSICPDWKYLIRKGVSFEHMRMVILEMFKRNSENSEIHYKTVFNIAFKDKAPSFFKNVPTFTENEYLPDMVKFHFLNEAGGQALKRLLWVFRKIELLEYSPLLTHVISFLLIFLSEAEVFCIINILIEESKKILKHKASSLKWHFTLKEEDHLKLSHSFFEKIKKKSITGYQILSHFEKINFDYHSFFHLMSQNFFLEFLKISDIFKFFVAFLNEGIKVHFRMVYAICKILKSVILTIYDVEVLQKVIAEKTIALTHSESKKLIKYAYGLKFDENECFSSAKIRPSKLHNLKIYYMPHVTESSEIIKDEQFEIIWEWLPSIYRIADPSLVFRSSTDGYFLQNLYNKLKNIDKKPMLVLVKTNEDIIFGAFSTETLNLEHKDFYGSNETFLFTLQPKELKFFSTNKNNNFIYCCKEYFSFGNGDNGHAFQINSDLIYGRSNISETFDNIRFTTKERDNVISCLEIEIYLIS